MFGKARDNLIQGKCVAIRLPGWPKERNVKVKYPETDNERPELRMHTVNGSAIYWTPDHVQIYSRQWVMVFNEPAGVSSASDLLYRVEIAEHRLMQEIKNIRELKDRFPIDTE